MMRPGLQPETGFLVAPTLAGLTVFRLCKAGISARKFGMVNGKVRVVVHRDDAERARVVIDGDVAGTSSETECEG